MVSMNSWILSMKVLLISAGVVSLAVGLRFVVPVAVSEIPAIWSVILSWLKPPYLYIIINGIIITIAASSHFHQSKPEPAAARSEHLVSVETPPPPSFESFSAPTEISTILEETPAAAEVVVSEVEDAVVELRAVTVNGSPVDIGPEAEEEEEALIEADEEEKSLVEADEDRDVFVDSTFMHNNFTQASAEDIISPEIHLESLFPRKEKPLVTSRFGHRKPNRPNPEGGRGLRVARAKKHDTLESTWKMITEGRHVPLTRHLKKSETFEHAHVAPAAVPKSETFKDRGSKDAAATAPPRIGREPSPGQDELNRRVEAFIKKFNEEMRMQRQESLNQYMDMINRGV